MRYNGGNSVLSVDRAPFATFALAMGFNLSEATAVAGESISNVYGIPSGVRHPQAWVLPVKGGAIKSYRRGGLELGATVVGEMGLARTTTAVLSLDATVQGGLVSSATCTATMTFDANAEILATLSSPCTATMSLDATVAIGADASITTTAALTMDAQSAIMGIGYFTATTEDSGALTPASIAAAVLSAAQTTPIHADIRKVNGIEVDGAGTSGDPWGPV